MKRSIEFECGDKTCASEPGTFCRFLDMGRWGAHPHCTAFNHPLHTDGGWLQRCEPCMELETMNGYITAEEAADILNVSVPWFITDVAPELTDKIYTYGKTAYGRANVLAWKQDRDERRSLALDELTVLGEEM